MSVSPDEVRRIADLAALEIPEDRLADLARDLDGILEYIGQLERVSDAGGSGFRPGPARAPLRADEIGSVPLRHELSTMAPDFRDGFFVVPRVEGVGDE